MAKTGKVAVVGSLNMDMCIEAERIPLKGETLMGSKIQYLPGGKGANQAYAAARFGAQTGMFGCVGRDENGAAMIKKLSDAGVNTEYIKVLEGVTTGLAVITLGDHDNTIVVVPGANAMADRAYIDSIKKELLTYDMVLLQHEIPIDTVHYVIDLCKEAGIPVVLNPAPAQTVPLEVIERVDYITPNEHEVTLIFEDRQPLEHYLKKYPEKLIVTLGEKGAAAGRKDGTVMEIPVRPARVADTTGAGDTFNGILTAMLARGSSLEEALRYSNTGASLSTEKFGAQGGMPTEEEIEKELIAI